MKRFLSLLMFTSSMCFCQTVPREMNFGGMTLIIHESTRQKIQKDVDRLTASQTYYGILSDRINLYFPIIENAFATKNVPDEIKFLAVQESALISDAVSVANAVGFWQFKDFTAREMDMKVDRGVDERLNIVSASYGSAKYLSDHNFFYNNWIYSVMAYNTGRGGAEKLIDKSKFGAKKMIIDKRTHWYVKKFLAHIVAFTSAVGLPHSKSLWLDTETEAGGMTLAQVAKKHKTDLEELKKYNKWLKSKIVPSDKVYSVLIPKYGVPPKRAIASNVGKSFRKISQPQTKIYPTEIKSGITKVNKVTIIPLNGTSAILPKEYDDVHSLSAKAGISEKKFRKHNDMGSSDEIIYGKFYYTQKKRGKSKIGFHVTQKGETLWNISQQYGIRLSKLARKNRMSIIDELKTGRILWLKKTRASNSDVEYHQVGGSRRQNVSITSSDGENSATYGDSDENNVPIVDSSGELRKVKIHTVALGESLGTIAQKYDISVEDLLRWNELPNPDALNIGQNIQVKAPIEEVIANKSLLTHRVTPGETLYAISRKYNMTVDELRELNNMKNNDLEVGNILKVFGE